MTLAGNTSKRTNFAFMILAGTLLAGLMLIYEREKLADQHHEQQLRLEIFQKLVDVREKIQSAIFDRTLEMRELSTIISQNPDISDAAFRQFTTRYMSENSEVINIALAPDLVVSSVFPLEGNESVIGLNYRDNQEQFPKVKQAMELGHDVVAGPINLLQGGQGLILRRPIFVSSENGDDPFGKPWGILSMVVNYDSFLNDLAVPELVEEYDLLIREVATENQEQQIFFGSDELLTQDPANLQFDFPFGTWELAATTKGGWPAHRPNFLWSVSGEVLVLALVLATIWYVIQLSEERRKAQKHLTSAIDAMPDSFVMFDPNSKLVMFNNKYRELIGDFGPHLKAGIPYEELLHIGLKAGVFKDALGREDEWMEEWHKMRNSPGYDVQFNYTDGRIMMVSDRVLSDGSTVGVRVDITELQKAKLAAEAANRAKSDFMAVLSHELRTPLTVMLGMARISKSLDRLPSAKALTAAIEELPEEHQGNVSEKADDIYNAVTDMMTKIENSGEHLLFLVNEILDFAKMEASGLVLNEEKTDIAEIVATATEQIRPMADQKKLVLEADTISTVLSVDRKRLQQVLLNLLGNAVKFTAEGKITVTSEQANGKLLIRVMDTGFGMPESEVEKVFEPFHQVDASNKRGIGGTGLGLAISREITEAHGGTLTAESVEGEGSTFILALPAPAVEQPALKRNTQSAEVVSAA